MNVKPINITVYRVNAVITLRDLLLVSESQVVGRDTRSTPNPDSVKVLSANYRIQIKSKIKLFRR